MGEIEKARSDLVRRTTETYKQDLDTLGQIGEVFKHHARQSLQNSLREVSAEYKAVMEEFNHVRSQKIDIPQWEGGGKPPYFWQVFPEIDKLQIERLNQDLERLKQEIVGNLAYIASKDVEPQPGLDLRVSKRLCKIQTSIKFQWYQQIKRITNREITNIWQDKQDIELQTYWIQAKILRDKID